MRRLFIVLVLLCGVFNIVNSKYIEIPVKRFSKKNQILNFAANHVPLFRGNRQIDLGLKDDRKIDNREIDLSVNGTQIHAVQSSFYRSPLEGTEVSVEGIITYVLPGKNSSPRQSTTDRKENMAYSEQPNSLWIQSPVDEWDADTRTSEAILVHFGLSVPSHIALQPFKIGDRIRVWGTVSEFKAVPQNLAVTHVSNVTRLVFLSREATGPTSWSEISQVYKMNGIIPIPINECLNLKLESRRIPSKSHCFMQPHQHVFSRNPFALGSTVVHSDIEPNRSEPDKLIKIDSFGPVIQPGKRGIDFYKSLEHMVVKVTDPIAISKLSREGYFYVVSHRGNYASNLAKNGPLVYVMNDNLELDSQPEAIFVSPPRGSKHQDIAPGDHLSTMYGILTYSYGSYRINLLNEVEITKKAPRPYMIAPSIGGKSPTAEQKTKHCKKCRALKVVSYNVESLNGGQDKRINLLGSQIVNELNLPDILALQEVQDNVGPSDRTVFQANVTLAKIIAAIYSHSGVRYEYAQIDPSGPNKDGGMPFGNIRPVFLYNPSSVTLSSSTYDRQGEATEDTTVATNFDDKVVELSVNPGRVLPLAKPFIRVRKPLVVAFDLSDSVYVSTDRSQRRIFLINCHLSSKMRSSPMYGSIQPPVNAGVERRYSQIKIIAQFVSRLFLEHLRIGIKNPNILVLGDMNEMEFVDALRVLEMPLADKGAGLIELASEMLEPTARYTYVFQGIGSMIDHAFASPFMADKVTELSIFHINTPYKYVNGSCRESNTPRACNADVVTDQLEEIELIDLLNDGVSVPSGRDAIFGKQLSGSKRSREDLTLSERFDKAVENGSPETYSTEIDEAMTPSSAQRHLFRSQKSERRYNSPVQFQKRNFSPANIRPILTSFGPAESLLRTAPSEVLSDHDPVFILFNFC